MIFFQINYYFTRYVAKGFCSIYRDRFKDLSMGLNLCP